MTRSRWLDPSSLQVAIGLSIAAALLNGVWILLDQGTPAWDQANYLWTTFQYKVAFVGVDPVELVRSIIDTDPGHSPLFTVLMLPLFYIVGPEPEAGLVLNLLVAPVLYFATGEIAWIVFRNWVARLLAIVLVATMPLMVGLFHEALQDFLLVTLCTLSLLLLLKTDLFQRRGVSLGLGLAMGLGTLTKVTFPAFVLGPLLVVLAKIAVGARRGDAEGAARPDLRKVAWNVAAAALVYVLVIAPWYLPNFDETVDYIESTTGGTLAEGAGPSDPIAYDALMNFTIGLVNFNVSWVLVLVGIAALALNSAGVRALFARPLRSRRLLDLGFVLAWILVPFLVVATAKNQDYRLMAAALPGIAVLVAGTVSLVPRHRARAVLVAIVVAIPTYQVINHTTAIDPGFLPDDLSVTVGSRVAVIPLDSAPIGYEELPTRTDYAAPVIEYVEDVSARLPGGETAPRVVCLLQSEAVVNGNTFRYLVATRSDPYTVYDIVAPPGGERALESALSGCEIALFVKQPPPADESRLTLVNQQFAATFMTPRLLRQFRGPSEVFHIGGTPGVDGEVEYLSLAERRDRVRVLVRDPIETAAGGP